jgi:DNA polymerase I-like protein with 3'-5' exonuclease and polymerase domains
MTCGSSVDARGDREDARPHEEFCLSLAKDHLSKAKLLLKHRALSYLRCTYLDLTLSVIQNVPQLKPRPQ